MDDLKNILKQRKIRAIEKKINDDNIKVVKGGMVIMLTKGQTYRFVGYSRKVNESSKQCYTVAEIIKLIESSISLKVGSRMDTLQRLLLDTEVKFNKRYIKK